MTENKRRILLGPVIPVEILDNIFQELSHAELLPLIHTNKAFHAIGSRILYRSITDLQLPQSVACLRTLSQNSILSALVRSLDITWQFSTPTENLYRLLHVVLKKLVSLTSLYLEFPQSHSPSWILDDCPFSLQKFTTSMHCKAPLAHFLDSQSELHELTLRGFQNDLPSILPLSPRADGPFSDTTFVLQSRSLPNLRHFRAIHAGPSVIASIAEGRPLESASVPLFPSCAMRTLDALKLTSKSLKRLSLMSFDSDAPHFLLPEIAQRFSELEALHVVVLLAEFTPTTLERSGPILSQFKALQYITFMATTGGRPLWRTSSELQVMAQIVSDPKNNHSTKR
ncbi:hypothetical protein BD779DRAFT_1004076 [Infundibulicybe gibba]|nr:hypothetical protein BD779DRAFT_1004076 [Infundibulicybe gibba]